MGTRTIKLTLAYDGSRFSGWQVQEGRRTVQGAVQEALQEVHGREVRLTGAGRTDAGVHAVGQVGSFQTDHQGIDDEQFAVALNANLPRDVRVLRSRRVPLNFDARRWAISRTYEYRLYSTEIGLPHLRGYCWRIRRTPDCARLNRIASALLGEQDFTTFTAAGDTSVSRTRRIYSAEFHAAPPYLLFRISGNAFLRKMVRSLMGTIVEIEAEGQGRSEMIARLDARERSRAGTTAPARGLYLMEVVYGQG